MNTPTPERPMMKIKPLLTDIDRQRKNGRRLIKESPLLVHSVLQSSAGQVAHDSVSASICAPDPICGSEADKHQVKNIVDLNSVEWQKFQTAKGLMTGLFSMFLYLHTAEFCPSCPEATKPLTCQNKFLHQSSVQSWGSGTLKPHMTNEDTNQHDPD